MTHEHEHQNDELGGIDAILLNPARLLITVALARMTWYRWADLQTALHLPDSTWPRHVEKLRICGYLKIIKAEQDALLRLTEHGANQLYATVVTLQEIVHRAEDVIKEATIIPQLNGDAVERLDSQP